MARGVWRVEAYFLGYLFATEQTRFNLSAL